MTNTKAGLWRNFPDPIECDCMSECDCPCQCAELDAQDAADGLADEGICQTVVVDGEPVLVRVTSLLTPEEVEAFAWVVRAAKRRYAEDARRKGDEDG